MELVVCKQLMQPQCQKWWFVIRRWYIIIIWNVTLLNCPASVLVLSVLGFLWSSRFHTHKQMLHNMCPCFPSCVLFRSYCCLHLWFLLFESISSKKTNILNIILSLSQMIFPLSLHGILIGKWISIHYMLCRVLTVICSDSISNTAANSSYL